MPAWFRRSLICLSTLVAAIVVVAGTDGALARVAERRAVDRFEAEIGPLNAAAILDLPAPEANAAIPLKLAIERLRMESEEEAFLSCWLRARNEERCEDVARVDALLERNSEALAQLPAVLALSRSSIFTSPPDAAAIQESFAYFDGLRRLVRLDLARARRELQAGRVERGVESLANGLRLADLAAGDPLLAGQARRNALVASVFLELRRGLETAELDAALGEARRVAESVSFTQPIEQALQLEAALFHPVQNSSARGLSHVEQLRLEAGRLDALRCLIRTPSTIGAARACSPFIYDWEAHFVALFEPIRAGLEFAGERLARTRALALESIALREAQLASRPAAPVSDTRLRIGGTPEGGYVLEADRPSFPGRDDTGCDDERLYRWVVPAAPAS